MYFEQFYLACLSHASYMIGSGGVAAVIDPQRDISIYLEEAHKHGLTIEHVVETHLHADFVSGHRELAALTGAKIYVGSGSGATFPHVPVKDGDEIAFGSVKLRFLETPGHTMESISIVVTDLERSPEPWCVLTGDTLFIGDVGRPDLAPGLTPQQLAGMLFDSLHGKLLTLPDSVLVYPAHGAGSLCGRQMSSERSSTIGQQRISNYALGARDKETFVQLLTAELPERPGYFALDAEINRLGAAPVSELPPPPPLRPGELIEKQQAGAVVLDTRPAPQFAAAHIPGSIHIGLGGQYASWAGTILGLDVDITIVAEDEERVVESRLRLARVGIERVTGYLAYGIAGWIREGLPVERVPQISVDQLHALLSESLEELQVIDVRRPVEWQEGHVGGSALKPLNKLSSMREDLDSGTPLAVYCKSGYRSSIAASLLQRAGFRQVTNVIGGFDAWRACNLPVAMPEPHSTAHNNDRRNDMPDYAHPETLVSTEWVLAHRADPKISLVEVDVDTSAYNEGHVPGAIAWAWNSQLCDTVRRDILSHAKFEELMSSSGIAPDTTVVLYGDNNNWFAAWAFWQMKIYGHKDVRIMNGGRKKWLAEARELSTEIPKITPARYKASAADLSIRAFLPQAQEAQRQASVAMVDVRSPQEFTGEILAPPGLPETCQRGGHIPGARSIPWGKACNDDGTFKSGEELRALYGSEGIDGSKPVIAYCRIGERSSHTWFVLKYLLGLKNVTNYDGSWTEWGNLVGAPVARGATAGVSA